MLKNYSCIKLTILPLIIGSLLTVSCSKKQEVLTMDLDETKTLDPLKNKGIGPIKTIKLSTLDKKIAAKGKRVFDSKCLACHKFDKKIVGPAMSGITKRRSPEWILNLLLNTNEMVEKDPIIKSMIAEYMTKMTFQDLSKDDAIAILEYFREKDGVQ